MLHEKESMMLKARQLTWLVVIALAMWGLATLYIYWLPSAFMSPIRSAIGFLTTLPIAWFSVLTIRYVAGLEPEQLLTGVGVVGAIAMMIDGVALCFLPQVYAQDPAVFRPASAWLLWGYGLSLAIALAMSMHQSTARHRRDAR
jgi:hypothetical protein